MSEQGARRTATLAASPGAGSSPAAPPVAKLSAGVYADALYNPQDLATNWAVWSIFKAGQILIAGYTARRRTHPR